MTLDPAGPMTTKDGRAKDRPDPLAGDPPSTLRASTVGEVPEDRVGIVSRDNTDPW